MFKIMGKGWNYERKGDSEIGRDATGFGEWYTGRVHLIFSFGACFICLHVISSFFNYSEVARNETKASMFILSTIHLSARYMLQMLGTPPGPQTPALGLVLHERH